MACGGERENADRAVCGIERENADRVGVQQRMGIWMKGMNMGYFKAEEYVDLNGVRIHYVAIGEGRPVLMVHGNGESHDYLYSEIDRLSKAGYRVFAPDSRGHGANEPLGEYHYADMAEDMFLFIKKMGLVRPAYFGHSDGGIIGLMLEINHPGTLSMMAVSGANLSPDGLEASFVNECAAKNEESKDPLLTLMLTEPNIDPSLLGRITIPVLVTAGENDLILPAETRRIAEHLPNSRLMIIKGEDHGSYIKDSDIMGDILVDFFNGRLDE